MLESHFHWLFECEMFDCISKIKFIICVLIMNYSNVGHFASFTRVTSEWMFCSFFPFANRLAIFFYRYRFLSFVIPSTMRRLTLMYFFHFQFVDSSLNMVFFFHFEMYSFRYFSFNNSGLPIRSIHMTKVKIDEISLEQIKKKSYIEIYGSFCRNCLCKILQISSLLGIS